jgi:O-antigen/teichoic acid export membrane protein
VTDQQQPAHVRIITRVCDDLAVEADTVVPAARPPARLRTDVFLTFGGKAATLLLGLATAVVIARKLGPEAQGVFAVAYSLTLLLTQFGGLGLTTANPYFVAREPRATPRVVGNSLWFACGLGILLIVAGLALKVVFPEAIEGLGWTPLLVTLAGVPAALAALFLQSVLLGEGRMVAYNAIEVGQAALTLATLVVGLLAFDLSITGVLAVLTASRYAATLGYLAALRTGRRVPDRALARRMLAYGTRIYVALLVSFLVIRLDLLLVNSYLGATEAGLYSVAATLADGMFVLPMVVGLNLFARVARTGDHLGTAAVFRSVAVLYGLLCLVTIPLAEPGIRLFFGDDFAGATDLYYWLLPGIFSLGMLTILSQHFAGRGFPTEAMAIWFVGLGLNIAINITFLPGRGAWVASLASSIAYAVLLALHMWLFAREAGGFGAMRPRLGEVVRFVHVALSRG